MKIAIIGCGYIGKNLIKKWVNKDHTITAITKDPKIVDELKNSVQKTLLFKNGNTEEFKNVLEENDKIILTITNNAYFGSENAFLKTANAIKESALRTGHPKTLIYTSRADVYGEQSGRWVDESSSLNPSTDLAKILIDTENILISLKELGWKVCVLRLAEVYGPNYEISQKIKSHSDYFAPRFDYNYTNMIHLDDILSAIDYVLTHNLSGIYNLADNDHTPLKELITSLTSKQEIEWQEDKIQINRGNRRVSNNKIKAAGYNFIHPNRLIF